MTFNNNGDDIMSVDPVAELYGRHAFEVQRL
jgi:hypothetical protein